MLPSALIAVALLAGPSAVWLLYRFAVQPRTSRYRMTQMGPLWICAGCRSANELGSSRCYRCNQEFDDRQLEVIDSVLGGAITILPPAVSAPRRADLPTEPRPAIAAGGRDPVAVGPGKPKVRASKPKVGSSKPKVESSKPKVESSKPKVERPGTAKVDRPRRPVAAGRSAPRGPNPGRKPRGDALDPRDSVIATDTTAVQPAATVAAGRRSEVRLVHQPAAVAEDQFPGADEPTR